MYLTKRQQRILGEIADLPGFKSTDRKGLWCIGLACDYTSPAVIYRLVDAALAGMGTDGDEVVATTPEGTELAELLTSALTKRQQQVLTLLLREYAFPVNDGSGLWCAGDSVQDDEPFCSASTLYSLTDAELIGFGSVPDGSEHIAALTPRGRRLAELLP